MHDFISELVRCSRTPWKKVSITFISQIQFEVEQNYCWAGEWTGINEFLQLKRYEKRRKFIVLARFLKFRFNVKGGKLQITVTHFEGFEVMLKSRDLLDLEGFYSPPVGAFLTWIL